MLNIVDYIDSDEEGTPKSSTSSQRKNSQQDTQNARNPVTVTDTNIPPPTGVSWQECYDENSGYTYYWNMHNGEVTWEEPEELKQHKAELEKYYQLVEANRRGLAVAAAAVLLKQKQQQQLKQEKDKAPPDKKPKDEKEPESEEDEKIEMITSYGNDTLSDSESDTEKANCPSQAKKLKLSNDSLDVKKSKKNTKNSISDVVFGPELPQMDYNLSLPPSHIPEIGPQRPKPTVNDSEENALTRLREEASHSDSDSAHEDDNKTDEDIIAELKQKALLLKKLGGEMPAELKMILEFDDNSNSNSSPAEESNGIQLLSGYGNESDSDPEENKPQSEKKEVLPSSKAVNKKPTTSSLVTSVRHFKKLKLSARGKALIQASITTQRARAAKLEVDPIDNGVKMSDNENKAGLGYNVGPSKTSTTTSKTKIMFVKPKEDDDDELPMPVEKDSIDNIDGCNVDEFSSLLKSKLSCLCAQEKKEESPLFRIKIQLETLHTAWVEQALSVNYLLSTCTQISQRLKTLEQDKLPLGWIARWDATQSKYYYVNEKENLKQYYFPNVSDGEEDMDLCTTPPHSPLGSKDCSGGVVVAPPIPGVEDSPPPPPPPTSPPPLPPPPLPPSQPPPPKPPPPSYSPPPPPPIVPPPPSYSPKRVPPPPPPSYSPSRVPPPPPSYPSPGVPPPPPIYSSAGVPPPPPSYSPTLALETKYSTAGPTPPPPPAFIRPVSPVPVPSVLTHQVMKAPQENTLLSELDSFYSDIASIESPAPQYSRPPQPPLPPSLSKPESSNEPHPPSAPSTSTSVGQTAVTSVKKKKKTTKVAPVLSMKKKNVSSLVAKWQQVQNDLS
ncbi:hypothetical protein WDU94_009351 [Cyamophila willieti]